MTKRVLVGLRLVLFLLAVVPATSCSKEAPKYTLHVDSPVAPFKAADPDDLVVGGDDDDSGDDDSKDDGKGDSGEE